MFVSIHLHLKLSSYIDQAAIPQFLLSIAAMRMSGLSLEVIRMAYFTRV